MDGHDSLLSSAHSVAQLLKNSTNMVLQRVMMVRFSKVYLLHD